MTEKQRQFLAWMMLLALAAVMVVWVRWAQSSRRAPRVTRIPVEASSAISPPQQIANAVSEAEAKKGVTAGTKFSVTIKVLTATHAEGFISMKSRGDQNFAADLVDGKWQVTLE